MKSFHGLNVCFQQNQTNLGVGGNLGLERVDSSRNILGFLQEFVVNSIDGALRRGSPSVALVESGGRPHHWLLLAVDHRDALLNLPEYRCDLVLDLVEKFAVLAHRNVVPMRGESTNETVHG